MDKETKSLKTPASSGTNEESREIIIHADFEVFVVGILLLQLLNSALLFAGLPSAQRHIVLEFWIGISLFLLIDALNRLRRASRRRRRVFTYYGWMTLAGSLPIPFVTSVRLVGMWHLLRRLKRGQFREMGHVVVSRHAQSTLLFVALAAVLVFEFGSISILTAELTAPDANIVTSQDAMWWSLVTISTVGYGDTYPTTYWGRIIGYVLIVTGVGLFTTTTSFLARWFLRPRETTREPLSATQEGPHEQIREIRSLLTAMEENHESAVGELRQRLAQLENSVAERGE